MALIIPQSHIPCKYVYLIITQINEQALIIPQSDVPLKYDHLIITYINEPARHGIHHSSVSCFSYVYLLDNYLD